MPEWISFELWLGVICAGLLGFIALKLSQMLKTLEAIRVILAKTHQMGEFTPKDDWD